MSICTWKSTLFQSKKYGNQPIFYPIRKAILFEDIKDLREVSKDLPDDFWITLIGDMITEEALPTYESWLLQMDGVVDEEGRYLENGWAKWIRHWTGEENRHGDVLNKSLYLSGRINMREVEMSMHHLISDGFDIGTSHDPYRNFVYTSFQELATYISHNNVSTIAKKYGANKIARMCKIIAGDEMRHHLAYCEFVRRIFEVDPSEMMLAVQYMFKLKIVMPAHFLREAGEPIGSLFEPFSNSAQRIGVYTAQDYIDIMKKLIRVWDIEHVKGLNAEAEKARDYIMKFPARMERISQRIVIPEGGPQFKWLIPSTIK